MRLLDRYIIRNFLQPYVYCILGFLSIWLIFDISDNSSTIFDERAPFALVVKFYWTQIPEVLVILLPVALLLALLFSLGRMSRANEIVSMLTAGVSVPRVVFPLLVIGLLTTGATLALNYSLAAHAELARKNFFDQVNRGGVREVVIYGQVFRNRTDHRTWYVSRFRPNSNDFFGVQIVQQDAEENIVRNYIATEAFYEPALKTWRLEKTRMVTYDVAGNITNDVVVPYLLLPGWTETPYRLSSANVRPEFLGISELQDYLRFNADFPETLLAPFRTQLQYRWALPWTCMVVAVMATPLGIGFSRRGILASVAAAIGLVFTMNFLIHLFLALGEGDRVSPMVAAWTPNLIFFLIGLYLLHLRATNREAPSFNPAALWRSLRVA
ncbi:MAG TPA: LptF/LptG family permease [Chthoniobacterales bacterium]|nr:LptF/LptG family permease [Chthoniobacterales bacterium]